MCKKKLESNIIIEKNIFDRIIEQLNLIKIDTQILIFKRKNTIIREANNLYANFS
jgi:hypothetical protein